MKYLCLLFILFFSLGMTKGTMLLNNNSGFEIKKPAKSNKYEAINEIKPDTVTLGGGCYWCMEAVFQRLKGVKSVVSGFSGGHQNNPSYKDVCSGSTGHAEVIQIIFDSRQISFAEILKVFFTVHDPTTLNRQGADVGEQYRSVIYYRNNEQFKTAKQIISELKTERVYDHPIVTQLSAFKSFFPAEAEHQNYYNRNKEKGYCKMVIQPKLEKFEKIFKKYYRQP